MGKYRFLAFQDRDEVFMPHKHASLPQMLEYLKSALGPKISSYTFLQHHFCTEKVDVLGGATFQKLSSTTHRKKVSNAPKSIIRPKDIINMHIHFPLQCVPGKLEEIVFEKIGTVNHFRNKHKCGNLTNTVRDFSMTIYQNYTLWEIESILRLLNIIDHV